MLVNYWDKYTEIHVQQNAKKMQNDVAYTDIFLVSKFW